MKQFVLICFLACVSLNLYAQSINGRILDKNTHQPLVFANVYFNGTIITGSTTDSIFISKDGY